MSLRMHRWPGLLVAAISASLIAPPIATSTADAASAVVATANGKVRGAVVDGGFSFRGLPYAAAPVGDLRWRAPRPAGDWHGVRDATQYSPSSPQGNSPFMP